MNEQRGDEGPPAQQDHPTSPGKRHRIRPHRGGGGIYKGKLEVVDRRWDTD
jgi:hypothetical protein